VSSELISCVSSKMRLVFEKEREVRREQVNLSNLMHVTDCLHIRVNLIQRRISQLIFFSIRRFLDSLLNYEELETR